MGSLPALVVLWAPVSTTPCSHCLVCRSASACAFAAPACRALQRQLPCKRPALVRRDPYSCPGHCDRVRPPPQQQQHGCRGPVEQARLSGGPVDWRQLPEQCAHLQSQGLHWNSTPVIQVVSTPPWPSCGQSTTQPVSQSPLLWCGQGTRTRSYSSKPPGCPM